MMIIADTNVWYRLSADAALHSRIVGSGDTLWATPTSLFEIASGIGDSTFLQRRAAAQAVTTYATGVIDNTERHLAKMFGLTSENDDVIWMDAFEAISKAKDVTELDSGVALKNAGPKLAVLVDEIRKWRHSHWVDFKEKVEDAIESRLAGYKQARQNGKCIHMKQQDGLNFLRDHMSPEAMTQLFVAIYDRTLLHRPGGPTSVYGLSREALITAFESLHPYMTIYYHYLYKCAAKYAPADNDFGDLECFIYAQEHRQILTFDDRWYKNALDSGLGRYILAPPSP